MADPAKLIVFGLPRDATQDDLHSLFDKYGKIQEAAVRNASGGGSTLGFVTFEHPRDCDEAILKRNNYEFDGSRLRVEQAKSKGERKGDSKGYGRGKGRGDSRGRGRGGMRRDSRDRRGRGGYSRRGDSRRRGGYRSRDRYDRYDRYYRRDSRGRKGKGKKGKGKGKSGGIFEDYHKVHVLGMPESASWQDLKDFCRKVTNEVKFADVVDGVGVVGFSMEDDAIKANRELDGLEFTARNGDKGDVTTKLQLKDDPKPDVNGDAPRRSRSRSPSARKSNRSRSPSMRKSGGSQARSRSRSRSASQKSRSRSQKSNRSD